MRAIKEIRFDENPTPSNSISGSSTDSGISTLFSQVSLNGNEPQGGRGGPASQSNYSGNRNGMSHRDYNDNGEIYFAPVTPWAGEHFLIFKSRIRQGSPQWVRYADDAAIQPGVKRLQQPADKLVDVQLDARWSLRRPVRHGPAQQLPAPVLRADDEL